MTDHHDDSPTLSNFEMPLVPDTLLHGADYNPEQWFFDPEVPAEDDRLMTLSHSNVMSIGMFSWSMLEPEEGVYTMDWLEDVLDRLHANGVYVFLATPAAARPAWLSHKYPEVMRTDANRVRHLHGQRHNHCYTSPAYREAVARINGELARRFSDHPAVLMWHINNEYGGDCHCEYCQAAFREWLKDRYGTLDALNHAWWTTFWSHRYTSWDQIESPSPIGELYTHGLTVDWRRFVTHQTRDFMRHEIASVRRASKRQLPVCHNFHDFVNSGYGLDYHKMAQDLDVVSWDNYPIWHQPGRTDVDEAMERALIHDLNRSLKQGRPFLLMESSPSATNWQEVGKLRRPGMHGAMSMQAVAHGSDSVQYFQWRRSLGSSEKFHGAVVDHLGNEDNRVFREVKALGEDLSKLGEVAGSRTQARVAVIYDWENAWAYTDAQGPMRQKPSYFHEVVKHYRAFREAGIAVDVISLERDLSDYRVVVAPLAYMMPEATAARVRAFVEDGGVFVTGCWSGIVNETDLCYRNGRPGPLREVMGIRVEETDAIYPGETRLVVEPDLVDAVDIEEAKAKYPTSTERLTPPADAEGRWVYAAPLLDLIRPESAETLMAYAEDFYRGSAAATMNRYGDGEAYYLGFLTDDLDWLKRFYQSHFEAWGLASDAPFALDEGLYVTERHHDDTRYFFVMNFTPQDLEARYTGEDALEDMLAGEEVADVSEDVADAGETTAVGAAAVAGTISSDDVLRVPGYGYRVFKLG